MKTVDWYRRPELALSQLLEDAFVGGHQQQWLRAVVLAVDVEGGKLQNPDGSGAFRVVDRSGQATTFEALVGPSNPRGAVKARILTDGYDRLLSDQETRVFWPMIPQDLGGLGVSPGEHVYVTFDGAGTDNGIWLARVPGHESAGSFQGRESYVAPSAPQSAMDSFEKNSPEYARDDRTAGLAPQASALSAFED